MFLGLDLGTSSAKAVLVDEAGQLRGEASAPIVTLRPQPDWSEQRPEDWWTAACDAIRALPAAGRAQVRAIGLSGQMHGATLLDATDAPLRPAILWNDGRAADACRELEAAEPRSRVLTGNAAMPGFTAPKLLWVRRHEPEVFARTTRVLLPKDYLRLRLTGEAATDLSDASGTLWLDCAHRRWSNAMLAACDLSVRHMPRLYEGHEQTGMVRREVADALGLPVVPVVAGGGDNAAGAVGCGAVRDGEAMLSLGTSGVIFVATERFAPAADRGAHAFCHALPGRWHQMGVILSAAASVEWAARTLGFDDVAAAIAAAETAAPFAGDELFLPYLSGERTPHNDAGARGVLFGLTSATDRGAIVRAVLEGVAFGLADALDVLRAAGTSVATASVIGGGARSRYWGRILAQATELPLVYREDAQAGPAFGAARLARLGVTSEDPGTLCTPPPALAEVEPDPKLTERAAAKRARYRALYPALKEQFR